MAKKKIVIVIVEGKSDAIALEGSLINHYKDKTKVQIRIIEGDITSYIGNNSNNIIKAVTSEIQAEMRKLSLERSDVLEVIHIVDMDGVYINDNSIEELDDKNDIIYNEKKIITNNKEKIEKRNKQKRENLNKLSSTRKINVSLRYRTFYFSCNQEHVLHNKITVDNREKNRLAEEFSDRYEENFSGFVKFISGNIFTVPGNYFESWEFIKKDNNSLKRFSNLHLLLKDDDSY